MARKELSFTVTKEGRDKGKTFLLTELPASQAEAWAMRAILALMAGGVNLPEGFERSGIAGMAELGIKALAGLNWEVAEPLLSVMMGCVEIVPNPSEPGLKRKLLEDDIEEVQTRWDLKVKVFELHTDFLNFAARSTPVEAAPAMKNSKTTKT